ncbi:hypothetical protein TSMEX_005033 [Taenia solium]|eukprot:TsM_000375600 transcript=TsM_000375600 gene=TsM_000375600
MLGTIRPSAPPFMLHGSSHIPLASVDYHWSSSAFICTSAHHEQLVYVAQQTEHGLDFTAIYQSPHRISYC